MTVGAFASSGPGPRGIPAIDRSVLGEWLAGDDTAIDELLAVFRDSVFAEQERMRDALALGDLNAYADGGPSVAWRGFVHGSTRAGRGLRHPHRGGPGAG